MTIGQSNIWRGMGAVLVGAAMCGPQAAAAAALNLTDGDKIKLEWGAGTYGHASGGGEFKVSGVSVLNGPGDTFLTFCMEFPEHISLGTAYYVDVNDRAISGGAGSLGTYAGDVGGTAAYDPLSNATAWLYTQFVNHTLAGFNFVTPNDADANSLQKAIWFLENEKPLSFLTGDTNAIAFKGAAIANAIGGFANPKVRVLNLWDTRMGTLGNYSFSGNHQDQLYMATHMPEPETYAMLLAGLGLLGFAARRRKSKSA